MSLHYKGDEIRANNILGLNGVDLTKWPTSDEEIAAMKSNIGYNAALFAGQHAMNQLGLVDGLVNPFTDEDDIDLPASSNQVYDAVGNLYCPEESFFPGTEVTSNVLNTDSGTWANYTMRVLVPASQISADGTHIKVRFEASLTEGLKIDHASIVERSSGADGVGVPTELKFSTLSGFDIASGTTIESDALAFTLDSTKDYLICIDVSSDTAKDLSRGNAGGNLSRYYKAASNSYNTQTLTGAVFNSGTSSFVNRISVGIPQGMVLVSKSITANAVPTEAVLGFILTPIDALTLNTDILGFVSRDGGTNLSQVTFIENAIGSSTQKMLTGSVDLTGQPSGSSMEWKLISTQKRFQFENVSLFWD